MTVSELITLLEKCNPEAKVRIWYEHEITHISEIGGDSFKTKDVRIWHDGNH